MAKTHTLTDNFTTVSAIKWGGYGVNPTVASGRLSIIPTSSYLGIYSATGYDFTGSYAIIQLVQAPNIGNGSISAAMSVQVSSNNTVQIIVAGTSLIFREEVANVDNDTSITFNAVQHAWWRIRELSGTVYWDTSPDSINWTNRRTKASSLTFTNSTISIYAGYWGSEPSPGTALFDNFNIPTPPPAVATGWTVGSLSFLGGADGGTVVARNYFDTADWLWSPIPANPVLDPNSANIVPLLASTAGGQMRVASMYDYGVTLKGPSGIIGATPRYDVPFVNDPAWGSDPFGSETVPIPGGTTIPPGTDGHVSIADPTTDRVYSLWQATHNAGVWGASWGAAVDLHGDGLETIGSSTATKISRYAAVIRGHEIAAGQIPHALFFATNMAHTTQFRYPASKTDGDNASGVAFPIPEGARVQLDPSIDVTIIPGITPAEIAIAKALQTYGAYCGDKGGSRMGFLFEYVDDGTNPGQVYANAGLAWDYFNMTHIPWASLRVLNSWDGS